MATATDTCSAILSEVYTTFLSALLGNSTLDKGLEAVLGRALDWQWDSYLSKQVPPDFMEEIEGIAQGGAARGVADAGKIVTRRDFPSTPLLRSGLLTLPKGSSPLPTRPGT